MYGDEGDNSAQLIHNLQAPGIALADAVEERLGLLTILSEKYPNGLMKNWGRKGPAFMRNYVLVVYFFSQ